MVLSGTHGTCLSCAKEIIKSQQFHASKDGHVGSGAYFWAYENNARYAVELAECWWAFLCGKGKYKDYEETKCAVLDAQIAGCEKDDFLDATGIWFRESLDQVMRIRSKSEDDLPAITEMLIQELQKEAETEFLVIKIDIKTPPTPKGRRQTYAQMVSKMSTAYVVKESGLGLIKEIHLVDGDHHEKFDG